MVKTADLLPGKLGEYRITISEKLPTATGDAGAVNIENSDALLPVIGVDAIVSAAVPKF